MSRQLSNAASRRIDAAWHAAMLAQGPQGYIRERGADTWEKLHEMCDDFVRNWEALPPGERLAYAFPNPEDRRPKRVSRRRDATRDVADTVKQDAERILAQHRAKPGGASLLKRLLGG